LTIRHLDQNVMPRSDAFTAIICYNKSDVYVHTNMHISTLEGKLSDQYEQAQKPVTADEYYLYRVSQEECARLRESVPYITQNTYTQS